MRYEQLTALLRQTGLSPEKLATRLDISNLTYRRWLKRPPKSEIPEGYKRNIAGGVHQLLAEGKLDHDSEAVKNFMEENLPEFFTAIIGRFNVTEDTVGGKPNHQDKMASVLSQIGSNRKIREQVDSQTNEIRKFTGWGSEWKFRITLMLKAILSNKLGAIDKLVAYGALFYLILPMDLIPDGIPVFGYVDDFGILGFATAYYLKTHPALFSRT